MSIAITERAALEVKKAREANKVDDAMFLRLGVRGGGCAGFDYMMHFDNKFDDAQLKPLTSPFTLPCSFPFQSIR